MNRKTPPSRQETTNADSVPILGVARSRLHLMSLAMLCAAFSIYLINVWRHSIQLWDDAFISFRFARHLADGHGFCWNIGGERVEGFTSMLHVLLLAAGAKLGLPLETTSLIIGVAGVVGTALLMVLILRACFGLVYPLAAFFPAAYLVDWTTSVHSTTGLETQLFVLLLCAALGCALLFVDRATYWRATCLGFCLFLAVLCRPDGVLYGAGLLVVLGGHSLLPGSRGPEPAKTAWPLCLAVLVLLVFSLSYVVWKYNYFGYLLPNPFYLKSNEISTQGFAHVRRYLVHALKWLVPPLIAVVVLVPMRTFRSALRSAHVRKAAMLVLVPPVMALAYYATILHEVGGAHRFGYPTYFYFVIASAALATLGVERARDRGRRYLLFGVPVAGFVVLLAVAVSQLLPLKKLPQAAVSTYHRKIGVTLRDTGIGRDATVICVAAGVIPFVSRFSHIDPVGLTDNFLSGRVPRSPQERDAYFWDQKADVYFGHEPPASPGSSGPDDDQAAQSPYVRDHLLGRNKNEMEDRFLLSEPELLYDRMAELRDRWDLVGEINWLGWRIWRLRSFVYVRKQSPFHETLVSALAGIVDVGPADIDLAHPPDYP